LWSEPARNAGATVRLKYRGDAIASRLACFSRDPVLADNVIYCVIHQIRARLDVSKRAYNFCAGPAALPEAVLQRAQGELLDWHGKGLSVMEMSHRSDEFVSIAEKAEQDLRDLLDIPRTTKCCSCRAAPASSSPRFR
jgi:hypothetical protein